MRLDMWLCVVHTSDHVWETLYAQLHVLSEDAVKVSNEQCLVF